MNVLVTRTWDNRRDTRDAFIVTLSTWMTENRIRKAYAQHVTQNNERAIEYQKFDGSEFISRPRQWRKRNDYCRLIRTRYQLERVSYWQSSFVEDRSTNGCLHVQVYIWTDALYDVARTLMMVDLWKSRLLTAHIKHSVQTSNFILPRKDNVELNSESGMKGMFAWENRISCLSIRNGSTLWPRLLGCYNLAQVKNISKVHSNDN